MEPKRPTAAQLKILYRETLRPRRLRRISATQLAAELGWSRQRLYTEVSRATSRVIAYDATTASRVCAKCEEELAAGATWRCIYCSGRCRMRAYRAASSVRSRALRATKYDYRVMDYANVEVRHFISEYEYAVGSTVAGGNGENLIVERVVRKGEPAGRPYP